MCKSESVIKYKRRSNKPWDNKELLGFQGQKNRRWNFVQTDINRCKVKNWKARSKNRTEWRTPLTSRRPAFDCSAIKEEEEKEKEEEEEEEE